ncbi:hypothetical protein [Nocardia suismassiliense]|uniref:hypothetical protein n=1 Tax=Nocardia suismassiliense TaxID=2077092 RepID=UPI00131F16A2|nr:hypothetical protein [Nocardia suismassiliense]
MAKIIPSLEYRDIYTASAWASLLGNVLVAEYFIVQRTLAPLIRRSDTTLTELPQPLNR